MSELQPADFLPSPYPQPLRRDEIHLWFFPRWPGPAQRVAESPAMRRLLAAYLARPVRDVRIARGVHGKPRLMRTTLRFNLSHSGHALLLALSRDRGVGVDLESQRRGRPGLALARRWFDPREAKRLGDLPEHIREDAFLRLWSCKEAVLKAHGRGIGYGLHRFALRLDTRGVPLGFYPDSPGPGPGSWRILTLSPGARCFGALAWRGNPCVIRAFVAQTG